MTRRRLLAVAILIVGGALLYLQVAHQRTVSQQPVIENANLANPEEASSKNKTAGTAVDSNTSAPATGTTELVAPEATANTPHSVLPIPAHATPVPETAESSSLPPATVLENMRTTVRQYGSTFGGNPVGTNPEITSALQGDNPKHINFLKPDGNRVNAKGELVDPWGTPYFFHQISGQEMEIRSAGPDGVMYTADDLVTR